MSNYRAIVLGGTGAVGSSLIRELISSPNCSEIVSVTRRPTEHPPHSKLQVRIIDMEKLEQEAAELAKGCSVAFCTLGMGQPSKASSKEEFWKVDVEYVAAFGRGCRAAGVTHISLLSAVYANSKSRIYYSQVKGSAEEALTSLGFERIGLFRPSLLATKTIRYGKSDRFYQALFPKISWLLPKRLHEVSVEDLGRAMRLNAEIESKNTVEILYYPEFEKLLISAR